MSFFSFLTQDDGAVTVDWVVLTAAIAGLGLASAAAVRTGTGALAGDIQTSLSGASVAALGTVGGSGTGSAGFDPAACAGGMEGVQAYADAMYADGRWTSSAYDYDYGEVAMIIDEARAYDDTTAAYLRDVWSNDYATRPEAFDSISNMVEMAVAHCVAAERGL